MSARGWTSSRPSPATAWATRSRSARLGLEHASHHHYDVVVVDTAGRTGVDAEMMQQAIDIRAAVSPDEVLFVLDAMVGQDAVATAEAFRDGVGFDGVVLTKLDGDARGGAALSVRQVTGQPVMFASTGEKLDDFELFHPDRMASRILDMGDVLSLIEQAEKAFDADQAQAMAAKFAADEDFTLDDFLQQLNAVRNMGSLKKMLGMLPGMAQMRQQLDAFDEREFDRIEAMVRSMTPLERRQPKIMNGSRRARVAAGCGQSTSAVNDMLERFGQAQKMMRSLRNGMAGGHRHPRDAGHGGRGRLEEAEGARRRGQGQEGQERQPRQARPAGAGRGVAARGPARLGVRGARPRRRASTRPT